MQFRRMVIPRSHTHRDTRSTAGQAVRREGMRAIIGAISFCWAAGIGAASSSLQQDVDAHLDAVKADLIEVRRDIHRHPEISGQEERTAGIVGARLKKLGYDV